MDSKQTAEAPVHYDSAVCRSLRRQIQAVRHTRLGWSDYVFYYVMDGLGYGRSLRALDEERLARLWSVLKDYRKHGLPVEYDYDRQGRYMYALQKKAGWDDRTLRAYLMITFRKSHWNLLSGEERKNVLDILKQAIAINREEKSE